MPHQGGDQPGEPVLGHEGGEDQEHEMAFGAFAAPERAIVTCEPEIAVAAGKNVVELGLAREERGDAGFRIGAQQGKILQRPAGRSGQHVGDQALEIQRFGILVIGFAASFGI